MLEACKNQVILLDGSMKFLDIHDSIFLWQCRSGKWCFVYGWIWSIFTLYFHTPWIFFADFYWDMLGNWTNIYNLCYHIVVLKKKIRKTVKNCSSGTLFGQKLGKHGPLPKWGLIFFLKITKGDHKLSRTLYFINIS